MSALLALLALTSASPAAAAPTAPAIEACRCHDSISPSPGVDVVDLRGWEADGPHRKLGCVACHPDAIATPHHPDLRHRAGCPTCHAAQAQDWGETVHGRAQGADSRINGCLTCHAEHPVFDDKDPHGRYTNTGLLFGCTHCHAPMPLDPALDLPLKPVPEGQLWPSSLHGLTANGERRFVSACWTCHGSHQVFPAADKRSAVNPAKIAEVCGDCHPGVKATDVAGRICRSYSGVSSALTSYFDIWYLWTGGAVALWVGAVAGALALVAIVRRRRNANDPGRGREASQN